MYWPSIVTLLLYKGSVFFFFFNDTATTEIYTLSLHDALPICSPDGHSFIAEQEIPGDRSRRQAQDRKSTRLNSSHLVISYAVFCLKKKKIINSTITRTLIMHIQPFLLEAVDFSYRISDSRFVS